ncbi:MAG: PP2C family protein-serine/threonine phosphatase [Tepidisphaeraceae bacterium]
MSPPVSDRAGAPSDELGKGAAGARPRARGEADGGGVTPEQMRMVLTVSRMLAVTPELDPLMLCIAQAACTLLGCERASIFLHDPKTDELWTKVALQSSEIRVAAGASIAGRAFRSNSIVHVPSPYDDPGFNRDTDRRTGFVTRNILAAPMVDWDRKPVGVLQAINKGDDTFGENDHTMIQLLADQAGVAVQRFQLQQQALQTVALRREMELARKVQQAMIPAQPPRVRGLEARGWNRPASVTCGDCYDLWQLPDGRLGIFVADASGHGIGPALVVSQVRTLARVLCDVESDPERLLARINLRAAADLEGGSFVTAFVGFLSSDGRLEWSSYGHGPIIMRAAPDRPLEAHAAPHPPLGILHDMCEMQGQVAQLEAGGQLILLSDGIIEARHPSQGLFGMPRVTQLLDANAGAAPAQVITTLRNAVTHWQGGDEPVDDQTLVVVRRTA